MLSPETKAAIAASHAELTEIRRDIHAHPELGMEETRTSALVAEKLRAWGIETTAGVGTFGVVGTIRGKLPGQRSIGLRADMDALAIPEATGVPYASQNPGIMHACGHDGHTTMLLGAAKYLAEHRDFAGTVNLIFQPAEEGRGGALAMLEDKLFERFPCDAIYGLHTRPGMKLGNFGITKGAAMAAGGTWKAVFKGTGGHGGATPHLASDVTVAMAQYIMALQTVVARSVSPHETAVVSVGSVHGGSAQSSNVMPAEVELTGTMRCFSKETQAIIDTRLRDHAAAIAQAYGCTVDVSLDWFARVLTNHAENTDVATAAASSLGRGAVNDKLEKTTGGEDFAFMLEQVPGAFMFLGNDAEGQTEIHNVHTPLFNFNDDAIPVGVEYWVSVVKQELNLAD